MANEASILNNPTSTPAAVSTGYQAQNTRFIAQGNGVDKTVVEAGTGKVTVNISGPVDVNGVLYSITSAVDLIISTAGLYVIYLDGSGNSLTPTLTTNQGTFDESKNARYTAGGKRILNWLIYYDGTDSQVIKWITPEKDNNFIDNLDEPYEEWITANGTWTAPISKYYNIYVTGAGGNGGAGGTFNTAGSAGGAAGSTGFKRIYINAGDVWTAAFAAIGAGATTFTDGTTTLSAGNQAGAVSGCDKNFIGRGNGNGGRGADGTTDYISGKGDPGGCSIYGGGGSGGNGQRYVAPSSYNGLPGGNATTYGGGGGCGGGAIGTSGSGGAGGSGYQGVIRIIG